MGLFGSEKDEREEVTLGVSEDSEEKSGDEESGASPEVGTIDFGGSEDEEEDSDNLKDEVSRLDSVREESVSKDARKSSSSGSTDLDDISKQNQQIIEKLDKILSKL